MGWITSFYVSIFSPHKGILVYLCSTVCKENPERNVSSSQGHTNFYSSTTDLWFGKVRQMREGKSFVHFHSSEKSNIKINQWDICILFMTSAWTLFSNHFGSDLLMWTTCGQNWSGIERERSYLNVCIVFGAIAPIDVLYVLEKCLFLPLTVRSV